MHFKFHQFTIHYFTHPRYILTGIIANTNETITENAIPIVLIILHISFIAHTHGPECTLKTMHQMPGQVKYIQAHIESPPRVLKDNYHSCDTDHDTLFLSYLITSNPVNLEGIQKWNMNNKE